ncbi:hypothetical protein [Metabacillus arenae]|uniref:Alpha/beta hydrolase n=1 Tax=Metabacillus arenae TaxID=2771434 RepID=A0A926NHN7_9BACI|nr:hypothetical protein [Metabacillus arenae]MBD1380970.1 hypothetical protein [Metabacillus arenae]
MAFTAFDQIDKLLTQPILLIAGSEADTRYFSEQANEMAKSDKELFFVKGSM